MIHHDHSHLRAYIIFFFMSVVLIGSLVYFYAPFSSGNLQSNTLTQTNTIPQQNESGTFLDEPVVPSADNTPLDEESEAERSAKRMRFTRLLLKYQADLQSLQAEKMNNLGKPTDPELDKKIASMNTRIENLENIITKLSE